MNTNTLDIDQIEFAEKCVSDLKITSPEEFEQAEYLRDCLNEYLAPEAKTVVGHELALRALRFRNHVEAMMRTYKKYDTLQNRSQLLSEISRRD
jgi:hypothetical protein